MSLAPSPSTSPPSDISPPAPPLPPAAPPVESPPPLPPANDTPPLPPLTPTPSDATPPAPAGGLDVPPSTLPSAPPPPVSDQSPPSPPVAGRPPSGAGGGSRVPAPRTSSGSSSDSSSAISTPVVVGIAVAGVIALVILSILFVCCKRKKRRPHAGAGFGYPPAPPPPLKVDPSGGGPTHWQQNVPPPYADHVVKIPPNPAPPPAFASRPPHSSSEGPTPQSSLAMPPPPPPFSSSERSSSSYSGAGTPLPPPSPGRLARGFPKSTFSYEELAMATDGFSDANLLGQGGFGFVHRGVLPNGKEVAVKQLKAGSGQGEKEFQAEVEIISRVHHKHLVSLVGYCISGGRKMLVYEFVPNNTLEFHLHGNGRPVMEWSTRLKIALGSAKGLAYLHEDCYPTIIHRDIKASNILLDFEFEAKVADFGLAKFISDTNTHVSTRVMGTFGYLAPEYASTGKLTDKSDVFSFGVMLLELITGRRPVDKTYYMDDSLVDWARPLLARAVEDGDYDSLADPRLYRNYNKDEMTRMIACAAACVRHSAKRRPRMIQVVRALEGGVSLGDLREGTLPGHSRLYGSSDYDSSSQP